MPFRMAVFEGAVFGAGLFANSRGDTECVEFVRRVTGAPPTLQWRRGKRVLGSRPGEIPRGTAIATFDESGFYPTDGRGRHAAIYLSHDAHRIRVLHQWNKIGGVVNDVPIRFHRPPSTKRSNNGDTYYVIEPFMFVLGEWNPCNG
jgi:hypothetical protein